MKIYQIQIVLKGSKPKIWRRLLIPSELLLSDFHMIIQISMGWENSHLHQFIKNRTFYTERMTDDDQSRVQEKGGGLSAWRFGNDRRRFGASFDRLGGHGKLAF